MAVWCAAFAVVYLQLTLLMGEKWVMLKLALWSERSVVLSLLQRCVLGLAACVVVAACATTSVQQTDEERIAARAQQRWDALVDGAAERAYEFETPAYRETHSLKLFRSRLGSAVSFIGAEVKEVVVDGDVADVRIFMAYHTLGADGSLIRVDRPVRESWVRAGGEWWHSSSSR
ncbi:hypothetical protein IAI53_00220 [Thauera sp. CAU 1555]|jgi:hypothetical protein|uniref:DUF4440 domain-containing protein n=1 Tax=Thauera sedimentorum TaxID=2767595 RepID=A0ABR9B7C1_9RHOO|nr:hypothetical protein [Thauera sedimentorum]MBC9070387.1 hypothetical protein [Thauera sedimentorum]MBD8501307.1 hypothetical protein [Thauera sedimentorum]